MMVSPAINQPPKLEDVVSTDPNRLGGEPVFKGTRVPVRSLFTYLRKGISLQQFLDDFEGVQPQQVHALLQLAETGIIRRASEG